ncbi:MAG TPA: hypothetical protein VKA95_10630, partial [Nitrososphaeraceae archaeon]|nr:hypothetical protein [Nitrososphaeraceae archaeon]
MVKKRVIANYFSDIARDKAKEKIDQPYVTDSFILGEIDETDIPLLKKEQGIIIEILDDKRLVETPGRASRFNTDIDLEVAASGTIDEVQPNFYVIEVKGPLLKEWRSQIDEIGVKLLASIPYHNFTAKLTPEQATKVKSLPFVNNVRLYDELDTNLVALKRAEVQPFMRAPGVELKMITYDVLLHDKDDLQKVLDWLNSHHVNIASADEKKVRIYLIENSPLLKDIRRLPEIAMVQEFVPSVPDNEVSRVLMGIDSSNNPGTLTRSDIIDNISQTGEGQIIAVADTGIYDGHPDFAGRIIGTSSWGRRNTNDHSD